MINRALDSLSLGHILKFPGTVTDVKTVSNTFIHAMITKLQIACCYRIQSYMKNTLELLIISFGRHINNKKPSFLL